MSERPSPTCPDCKIAVESCRFTRTFTGVKWKHIAEVYYCPQCEKFFTRTNKFLDGPMCKAADLQSVRSAEEAAFNANKVEWLEARKAVKS